MTGTQVDRSQPVSGFRFNWPFPKEPSQLYRLRSYVTISFVTSLSKVLFVPGANKLIVHNRERFMELFNDRSRPLITVSNHRCNIDDPLMWSFIKWRELLANIGRHRFTLAAHNICFTKQWHTTMFSLGRCVPCVRGDGVYQEGMNFSVDALNKNDWIHIFPEGKVSSDAIRFKWGVGRLIADCKQDPVVLPIWCNNMDKVWPVKPPYYPRFGQTVDVHIGEPIETTALRKDCERLDAEAKRKIITDAIQDKLYEFGQRLGYLPPDTAKRIADGDPTRHEYHMMLETIGKEDRVFA